MATGILLVHGFSGSPGDFGALPALLAERFGAEAVCLVELSGQGGKEAPRFDADFLTAAIRGAALRLLEAGRDLVVVGHSTGGSLALSALEDLLPRLSLLVLAAVPKKIDGAYMARWQEHAGDREPMSLTSLALLVQLVNRLKTRLDEGICPVLLIQGDEDRLVLPSEARLWAEEIGSAARTVWAPGGGHHLFRDAAAGFVQDLLLRAAADAPHRDGAQPGPVELQRLIEVEPAAASFFERSPASLRHLVASPAGSALASRPPALGEQAAGEPLFLNVEVTTRCSLRCAYCARTALSSPERDMPLETFRRVLDLVPHAYRVTLVGLGEPLMHPQIAPLVKEGTSRGRRVSLVTNGMGLTREIASDLVAAGLHGITFSLDAVSREEADRVRAGSAVERILSNIRDFDRIADPQRRVSRAVFTAVSAQTLPHLEELLCTVATLGVDAVMLSDLNFPFNAAHALGGQESEGELLRRALRRAFSLRLPVLSVHGLEELGLARRYHRHLLGKHSLLSARPSARKHCASPWQTLPVAVDGTVTVCDCQPEAAAGNLLTDPFERIWQGPEMAAQRNGMLGGCPPGCCLTCPRF